MLSKIMVLLYMYSTTQAVQNPMSAFRALVMMAVFGLAVADRLNTVYCTCTLYLYDTYYCEGFHIAREG